MPTQITGTSITTPTIDLTTPLAVADGGTGISTAKGIAQIVTFQTGAVATGTTIIPFDNTIPQITEGNEYMTLAITPTNASSTLEIDVEAYITGSISYNACVALFQDSTANAIAATSNSGGIDYVSNFKIKHIMTAGTTSSTTFRVRAGLQAAGTLTFNGVSATGRFGGVSSSRITIKEYLP